MSIYINNRWQTGRGPLFTSYNPADENCVWEGAGANGVDVEQAVAAARNALANWANAPFAYKTKLLGTFKGLLEAEKQALAETISMENGKPLWDALSEVNAMIGKIDISIEAYAARCPEMIKGSKERQMVTRHRPHGVVAILGPFNFPGHLPNGHIIPSLLAGNTIIFKASEMTPLVAQKMFEIWQQVGLPEGVVNLLQGGHLTGRLLAEHRQIDGLFFTGSWSTGSLLSKIFAERSGKILALEMGGNNPLIVTNVSDLKAAAYTVIQSAYLTSGQRCTCARRLIVPRGEAADAFIQELMRMIKTIHVGPYTDNPEPFIGPVISRDAASKLLKAQENLKNLGGIPLIEMRLLKDPGSFLSPGLIDVSAVRILPDEEYFGPLLQLIRVDSLEKAIEEAAKTEYGLTAGLLSDSRQEFDLLAQRLKVGILCWNSPTTNASSALPFGGTGKSGNFRPTAYYAADYCAYPATYVESQNVTLPETLYPGIG